MTFNFYLGDPSAPETSIYLFVRSGRSEKGTRNTIKINTGLRIKPKHWNARRQEVSSIIGYAPEYNAKLGDILTRVNRTQSALTSGGRAVSFIEMERAIRAELSGETRLADTVKTFAQAWDLFFTDRGHLASGTLAKYTNLRRHLDNFAASRGLSLAFELFTVRLGSDFRNYLLRDLGMTNATVNKNIRLLRTFLGWANGTGLHNSLEFTRFKPIKEIETDLIYLEEGELFSLLGLDLSARPSLSAVRDVFCFACFTGQRWGDIERIEWNQIKGRTWIIHQEKTNDYLHIPLSDFAIEILARYKGQDKPLPIISGQKTNDYLKTLCHMAGITDKVKRARMRGAEVVVDMRKKSDFVSFHTARKTFVTLSLKKGMSVETVMKVTGIDDYETMKRYIKVTERRKVEEMEQVWSRQTMNPLHVVKS